MENPENMIKKYGGKKWIDDKYNKILLVLIIALVIYRFYWFFQVGNQPLWYDEAVYMNTAGTWLGNVQWDIEVIRPVLLPFIALFPLGIGFGETGLRLILLAISIGSIPFMYGIGRIFFNKKVGLVAAFILAVFWSYSFYTYRILADVPVAFLWIGAIYYFFRGYLEEPKKRYFIAAGIFLGLTFLMKYVGAGLVITLTIYLLTTEKLKIFKNKKIIIFYLTALLTITPFLIWEYIKYGHPLAFYLAVAPTRNVPRSFLQSLIDQTLFSVNLMHSALVTLFLIGLAGFVIHLFLLYRKILTKGTKANKIYFIFAWLALTLVMYGKLNYGSYMDERYYFIFYPAIFLMAGFALVGFAHRLRKVHKYLGIILIIAALFLVAYQNIPHSNQIIEAKQSSFGPIREAGEWVKQNTQPGESILVMEEYPEFIHYTQRDVIQVTNLTQMLEVIPEKQPTYVIVSFYYTLRPTSETKDAIQRVFTNQAEFTPVKIIEPFIDQERRLPSAAVFKINLDKFNALSSTPI